MYIVSRRYQVERLPDGGVSQLFAADLACGSARKADLAPVPPFRLDWSGGELSSSCEVYLDRGPVSPTPSHVPCHDFYVRLASSSAVVRLPDLCEPAGSSKSSPFPPLVTDNIEVSSSSYCASCPV